MDLNTIHMMEITLQAHNNFISDVKACLRNQINFEMDLMDCALDGEMKARHQAIIDHIDDVLEHLNQSTEKVKNAIASINKIRNS